MPDTTCLTTIRRGKGGRYYYTTLIPRRKKAHLEHIQALQGHHAVSCSKKALIAILTCDCPVQQENCLGVKELA